MVGIYERWTHLQPAFQREGSQVTKLLSENKHVTNEKGGKEKKEKKKHGKIWRVTSAKGVWANQPIHSFLLGCLNPCLQGTSVRVGSPQLAKGGRGGELWGGGGYGAKVATWHG